MAKYTMELRKIIEYYGRDKVKAWFTDYELTDYLTAEEIAVIEKRGTWNKSKLAEKILNHYYFREIGFETPEMFSYYCKSFMKEIMDKKLQLIYSASIHIDPLVNVDYTETYKMDRTGEGQTELASTGSSSSNATGSGLTINSDTPQGQISKIDILEGKYASQTSANEGKTNTSGTSNINDKGKNNHKVNENWERRKVGNDGITATQQALIKQYRQILIGIDEDIINECNVLFMGIY